MRKTYEYNSSNYFISILIRFYQIGIQIDTMKAQLSGEALNSPYLEFTGSKRWGTYFGVKAEWWIWN